MDKFDMQGKPEKTDVQTPPERVDEHVTNIVNGTANVSIHDSRLDATENDADVNTQCVKVKMQKPALHVIYWCVAVIVFWLVILFIAKPINTFPDTAETNDNMISEVVTTSKQEMSDEDFINALQHENSTDADNVDDEVLVESLPFYNVDRTQMQSIQRCVGYINIEDTYVSDWVVQADDNTYYLDVDAYGNVAESGAVFGDYRNDFDSLNRNNIIYAHNMADGTRFGTLQRLIDANFYTDADGEYRACNIAFDSPCYNNIFRVYSVYEIDLKTFNYIRTAFEDDTDFRNFVTETRKYNTVTALENESIPANTKLLTLSTCTEGGKKRLVVHAYLYARGTV